MLLERILADLPATQPPASRRSPFRRILDRRNHRPFAPQPRAEFQSGADQDDDDDVLLLEEVVEPPEPCSAISTDQSLLQQVLDALASRNAADQAPEPEQTVDTGILLRQVLAALSVSSQMSVASSRPCPGSGAPSDDDDGDILLLDDGYVVAPIDSDDDVLLLEEADLAVPPPAADMNRTEMTALIAAATPDGVGTLDLPARLDVLARLLLTPPDDFTAQDLLHQCWPRGSTGITSRALLAVATNLSRNFGMPGKLPMSATKAWRMLDTATFQGAMAARLAAIAEFIAAWQKSQYTFLSLEFGEIELIEYLFEALHPGHNIELLASVMHFKAMSGRRVGLLRRIPVHARMVVEEMGIQNRDQSLIHLAHVKVLLERIADPGGFPPIVETASRALIEIEKLMKQVATPPPPPQARRPDGLSGLPLARL